MKYLIAIGLTVATLVSITAMTAQAQPARKTIGVCVAYRSVFILDLSRPITFVRAIYEPAPRCLKGDVFVPAGTVQP